MKKNKTTQSSFKDSDGSKQSDSGKTVYGKYAAGLQKLIGPCFQLVAKSITDSFRNERNFFITVAVSFIAVLCVHFFIMFEHGFFTKLELDEFEVGRVAERDITAVRDVTYIDQAATDIKRAELVQLVNPIFRQSSEVITAVRNDYAQFCTLLLSLQQSNDEQFFIDSVQKNYEGFFEPRFLKSLFKVQQLDKVLAAAQEITAEALTIGIIEMPEASLDRLNQQEITLVVYRNAGSEYLNTPVSGLLRPEHLVAFVKERSIRFDQSLDPDSMAALITPFLRSTAFYDERETHLKVQETIEHIPPVTITIKANQRIIKRGFIVTPESYKQLEAYTNGTGSFDIAKFLSVFCYLFCMFAAGMFTFSQRVLQSSLKESQKILLVLISAAVYIWILFMSRVELFILPLDILPVIPIGVAAVLILTLISKKIAVMAVFYLTFVVLSAAGFKLEPALFAFLSGLVAVSLITLTGFRMELITLAYRLALVNPLIACILMGLFPHSYTDMRFILIGAVVNGFMSGIFVLGLLPIFEDKMNTPSYFRLKELAAADSPTLREMQLRAPGTFHHTRMVELLAVDACKAIGANELLARVGALYHDIGKIKHSEYFVENQTSYNKHLDLNPRMSAAIIRSHISRGIEDAEKLRLPKEVIDIIGEHHGNSLVAYFYAKAKEADPNVSPVDFSYPGQSPRTKESAIVMLADMTEAACRTLENPSFSRLEKFIHGLVEGKIKSGQLDNSDLTFRELKQIESSFTHTLTYQYHSRIKYPNQKDPDADKEEKPQTEAVQPLVKEISSEIKTYITVDLGLETGEPQSVKQEGQDE